MKLLMQVVENMEEVNALGLNLEHNFDELVEQKIGAYIYILIDPRFPQKPFYVGKGGGAGKGNDRLVDHFNEARKHKLNGSTDLKIKTIHDIWSSGLEVDWLVYPCKMANSPSDVAEYVEGCLIQYSNILWPQGLTNKNIGLGGRFLTKRDIQELSAQSVKLADFDPDLIDRPIMLFPIGKSHLKLGNFDTALRVSWKVSARNRKIKNVVAVGLIGSIAYHVIEVDNWKSVGKTNDRFEIEGRELVNSPLLNRDFGKILEHVMGYWKFGCGGGGIIFKVDEIGSVQYLRGKPKNLPYKVLL